VSLKEKNEHISTFTKCLVTFDKGQKDRWMELLLSVSLEMYVLVKRTFSSLRKQLVCQKRLFRKNQESPFYVRTVQYTRMDFFPTLHAIL